MRLVEYLFGDPGGPPQPDHGTSDMLSGIPGERTSQDYLYSFGGERGPDTQPSIHISAGTAHLSGQPVDFLARGYTQEQAMAYRQMLGESKQYRIKDQQGNNLSVEVEHDTEAGDYVAVLRGGRYHRMASGAERQQIRDHATGKTPEAAVKALQKKLNGSIPEHSVQRFSDLLDEDACGQCFDWAYKQFMAGKGKVTLHHGTVIWLGESQRKDHAWITRNGRIFDWQMVEAGFGGKFRGKGYPKDVFADLFQPKSVKTYKTDTEAIHAQGVANKRGQGFHYGPWESLDEAGKAAPTHVICAACKRKVKLNRLERLPKHGQRGGYGECCASGYHYTRMGQALQDKADSDARRDARDRGESLDETWESLDEVVKKGKNEPSAGDTRAIKHLQDGKYPAKAEDGKGFCFQWADGRGICAFKWRNDALRWAKEQPRDIVKFWYGDPVHSNGKFRIRVSDRYRKHESLDRDLGGSGAFIETFNELLERRADEMSEAASTTRFVGSRDSISIS